jgi:hypothetical protein
LPFTVMLTVAMPAAICAAMGILLKIRLKRHDSRAAYGPWPGSMQESGGFPRFRTLEQ